MSKSIPDTLKVLLESPLSREAGGESLQKQLYQRILEGVREGSIPPETRLPGTRQLAESLAIARNTVIAVFEQLAAEGIIFTSTRGSIVSGNLESINAGAESLQPVAPTAESGYQLPSIAEADLPFFSGIPALGHFPLSAWRRTEDKVLQNNASSALGYGDPAGEPLLRETIATHLTMTRGVRCKPSQVFITAGLTKSMSMLVRMLTRPGDTVWMEDPGYWGARALFTQSRLNIHSVPVDQEGVSPPSGDWLQHPPKLIYTTPNHQYPTGVVLSQHRRMELIQAAQTHGTWILEDDYGSELRLHSESLVSMQGLTENAPVIYINSFSKTMFPALRIGYFVLPETLIPRLDAILMTTPHGGNKLSHLAMAEFISSGRYYRHVLKMRSLYKERQQKLLESLSAHLTIPYKICGEQFGLQLVLILPASYPDTLIAVMAKKYGMSILPVSQLVNRKPSELNGILLGYGNTSPDLYDRLVIQLNSIINQIMT